MMRPLLITMVAQLVVGAAIVLSASLTVGGHTFWAAMFGIPQ